MYDQIGCYVCIARLAGIVQKGIVANPFSIHIHALGQKPFDFRKLPTFKRSRPYAPGSQEFYDALMFASNSIVKRQAASFIPGVDLGAL